MQRTIILKILPSNDQAEILKETSRDFTSAFNQAVKLGWDAKVYNATKLHYLVYYAVKSSHPKLVSDLINQARVRAAEALRSAHVGILNGRKANMPTSENFPPRYNANTYKIDWESKTVRMSTTGGRQTIRFEFFPHAERYIKNQTDTADLIFRNNNWWFYVVVTLPESATKTNNEIVGIDLGVSRPAVSSTNNFFGSRAWKNIEGRVFHIRNILQKRGTKSAKRHLRKIRRKQSRFRKNCDHVVSKQIVQSVSPGTVIVVENLTNIRKNTKTRRQTQTRRRIHGWSFAQLKSFIEYKAEERGCMVVAVDPRHTSQACSRCGHIARNNRRSRSRFVCRACNFELHADLNAARNIAAKYHASIAMCDSGGLPINQPIASDP